MSAVHIMGCPAIGKGNDARCTCMFDAPTITAETVDIGRVATGAYQAGRDDMLAEVVKAVEKMRDTAFVEAAKAPDGSADAQDDAFLTMVLNDLLHDLPKP